MPPPLPAGAELAEKVLLVTVDVLLSLKIPPPPLLLVAELAEKVLFVTLSVPAV